MSDYCHVCFCPECSADITDFAADQFDATRAFEDYTHSIRCPACGELISIVFRFEMETQKIAPFAKARLSRWYDDEDAL